MLMYEEVCTESNCEENDGWKINSSKLASYAVAFR